LPGVALKALHLVGDGSDVGASHQRRRLPRAGKRGGDGYVNELVGEGEGEGEGKEEGE
jgi:hypothetical protein